MNEKLYGPFEAELKIHVTDGTQVAVATASNGLSKLVDIENLKKVLESTESAIKEQLGDEWRLCTKREYFNSVYKEKTGSDVEFAVPGGPDWDG